jgi:autotransporter-associated beta strand protein
MKPVSRIPNRFLIAGTVAATFSIVPPTAFAATFIKANNTTALNAAGSYTANSGTPTGTDIVQFDSTVLAASAVNPFNTGGNVAWGQLSITNPGAAISIANNTITLNGVGGVGIDMSSATQDLTITSTVSAANVQSWNIGTGRTLTLTAVITNPANVTLAGAGNFTSSASNTFTTNSTLGGNLTQFGNTLTVNGSGQFSALANLTVTGAGTAIIGATSGTGVANRINPSATLTMGGVGGGGTFTLAAGATGPTNTQTLAGLNVASGSSTINNTNGANTLNFTATGGAGYTRATGGFVNFGTTNSASFTNAPTAVGGSSVIGSGGNEILVGATLADSDFIAATSGNLTAATYSTNYGTGLNTNVTATVTAPSDFTTQSLHFGTTGNTTLTLAGTNTIESGMILNGVNGTATITGGNLQPTAGGNLIVYSGNGKNYTISSTLSDNSGSGFERYGAGTILLSGNNTFTGQVYLAGGTTNLGSNNALGASGTTSNLNIVGTTNLNLSGTGLAVTSARNIVISGGQTFAINTNGATNSMTLSGTISRTAGTLGSININKTGLGTLFLTGNTVGTPNLGLSFGGGNLDVTGQIVTSNAGWNWGGGLAGSTVTVHGNGILQNAGDLNLVNGNTAFTDLNIQDNGQIILNGRAFLGKVNAGQTATVNINQSGGLFQAALFQINASNVAAVGSATTYNLNGGIMRTNGAIIVDSNSTLNLNGGTVNLTGNNTLSVANAQSGVLGKVVVQAGGAKFNVNTGLTYTVSAALQHDSSLGATIDGGLLKQGPGTLTLTGANSYTGDTTIQAGTLSINSGFLADGSNVLLSTGSIFNLNFTGTDDIAALYIDGLSQAIGTWGSLTSSATNKSALFTGAGILNVTAVPEPSTWGLLGLGVGVLAIIKRRRRMA